MSGLFTIPALIAAGALFALGTAAAAPPTAPPETRNRALVLVHYMPWFKAKPVSPAWGWHWTMNAFDPEQQPQGKRRIASHYYPLIGAYDSGDPAVLEYHLLLMKLAGIDGVIADWYGLTDLYTYPVEHRNTTALFAAASKVGLKIAVCYEDQTVSNLMKAGKLPATDRVKHARAELDWLRKNWFNSPAYVRVGGRPLLLSFGFDGLTDAEWDAVLAGEAEKPLYLSERRQRSVAAGTFDWPVPKGYPASLERYYQGLASGAVTMPVAFPRFHDIYAEAKVGPSYGSIPDDEGRTWETTLRRAMKSGAPLVQLATWNDWGEGTGIEPTEEFGYRDLEVLQRLRREAVDADFAFQLDDLRLPYRLLRLRREPTAGPQRDAELEKIAQLLAAGSLSDARAALHRLEDGARP